MYSNAGTQLSAIIKIKYNWDISKEVYTNYWYRAKLGDYIESPTFCDDNYKAIKWRLRLYPIGLNTKFKGYVSLFAKCEFTSGCNPFGLIPPTIKCVLKSALEKNTVNSDNQVCVSNDKSTNCWGFPKFMLTTELQQQLLSGSDESSCYHWKFSVECDISHNLKSGLPHTCCPLPYDIGQLLETQKFSDVELKVNKETFHAHKLILAARSPVFAAMFEHEMLEKAEGFVDIVDTDENVFKEMLTYIYTEEIPNLKHSVLDLLPVADKYQLDHLKAACATYLLKNLTMENILNVLILANRHCLTQLKAEAIAFVNTHKKEVIATDGYKLLATSDPHLIVECYEACK